MDRLGNPSSPHQEGREAALLRDSARSQVAGFVGARTEEVFFTSSGTEANGWALTGLAEAHRARGRRIVVSAVEHSSILQTARRMEKAGWEAALVPVDRNGRVDLAALRQALTPDTVLMSIQWANPEVGTLQPVVEAAELAKSKGIRVHSDAVAAAGQVPIDLARVPVDALSIAGNTLGAPAGIGALVLRKGVRIAPLFIGGTQEDGRRAGTENLLGIAGMGCAAELLQRELALFSKRITPLRDRAIRGILEKYPGAVLHGDPTERLPGHISVSLPGMEAEGLVLALDMQGIAVGVGSACSSLVMKASHVLRAMGIPEAVARRAVTCTMGVRTLEEEVDRFLEVLESLRVDITR